MINDDAVKCEGMGRVEENTERERERERKRKTVKEREKPTTDGTFCVC